MAAFDRYLPAMLRFTAGSAGDLVEACAAMPCAPPGAGEALPVALFRSVIAYARRRRSPPSSMPAINGTRLSADGQETSVSQLLSRAVDDLRTAVREVVVLRDVAGLLPSEVEAILQLSRRKQAALLREGRIELCAALERGRG